MLATVSLGAIWTAVSPDTGVTAVMDSPAQVQPQPLFTDNAVVYNAKRYVLDKAMEIISGLPSLEAAVVLRTIDGVEDSIHMPSSTQTKIWTYERLITQADTDGRREKQLRLHRQSECGLGYGNLRSASAAGRSLDWTSLCLGRRQRGDADETVVLFLKKRDGSPFSAGLEEELSSRHVPDAISECPKIPVPANRKKVEVLVKKILWAGSCIGKPLALSQLMLTFARLSWLFDFIKADAGLDESDWREWDEAAEQRKERQVQEYAFEDHATGTKRGPVLCFRPREGASTSH
ncbi:hypothetical protein BDW68DRAFT_183269 [Aspergillus falconensis]